MSYYIKWPAKYRWQWSKTISYVSIYTPIHLVIIIKKVMGVWTVLLHWSSKTQNIIGICPHADEANDNIVYVGESNFMNWLIEELDI